MLKRRRHQSFLFIALLLLFPLVAISFFTPSTAHAVNNGLAITPPMGWNNYNRFGCGVGESTFRQQADAMVNNGLKAVGYQYINIDDCWSTKSRNGNGNLVPDPNKFPSGIKALADYVHNKGLKLGIYTDAGTATCSGYPGMYGHEQQDANTYASWGIDYLKVDWCSNTGINAQTEYTKIGNALRSSGRAITYSLCDWGQSSVWTWAPGVGNLWRTTGDISDNWTSMLSNFDSNASHAAFAGPGGWNDPDMLEVGNGGMSTTEDQTHFSLWAISAAPLILGNDMTNMSSNAKSILTNTDVIAVDQDSLGSQGIKVSDSNGLQVWSKKLQGTGNVAVVLLNRNSGSSNITVNWSNIGISGSASVRNLWSHSNVGSFNGSYTANVAGHGVVMLKISSGGSGGGPTPTPTPAPGGGSFNPNAHYKLINRNSGQALDVSGASTANGATIDQWPDSGTANQQWSIVSVGGYYKLINRNSGQALDISGASTANGATIDQWPDSGTANQQWNLVSSGGYYTLVNHNSGKDLDVSGGSTANGAQVIQWTNNGGTNQQWSIVQV